MSKSYSAAGLALISSRQFGLCALYDITLPSGQVVHLTSGEFPLQNVLIYTPAGNFGPFNYQTGMTIVLDSLQQKSGTEAGTMKVALIPQNPTAERPDLPILFDGFPLMMAADLGLLQGSIVTMSKFFYPPPAQTNGVIQTTQGAMGAFQGTIQGCQADRFFLDVTVEDYLSLLGDQQMPKNLFAVGCFHQVYDMGCDPAQTLLASKTVSGTLTGVTDGAHFTTNLTQADDYFDLGGMQMTSGPANGLRSTVSSSKNSGGAVVLVFPFATLPAVGNTFTIYPGCDRQQATCTAKFSTGGIPRAQFGGVPYMPVPSTVIAGEIDNPTPQPAGGQAGYVIGSPQSANQTYYAPGKSYYQP